MRELPTTYLRPPWNPVNAWDRPIFEWNIFPESFRGKFRGFVRGNSEDNPQCQRVKANIRTTVFYDHAWACVSDSIRRDRTLTDSVIVFEYVNQVIYQSCWWCESGRFRLGWYEEDIFATTDRPADEPPMVVTAPPRGATRAATPAARGGQQD
jgi:hypothetical protein